MNAKTHQESQEILKSWQFDNEAVYTWLATAPVNLQSRFEEWNPNTTDAKDMQERLESIAIAAAVAAEYIGTRAGTDGTGQHSHKDAIKPVNKIYKTIRGALGFTKRLQRDIL